MTETCDTSVLVPALVSWHEAHDESREALRGVGAVGAHVLLEAYSVLTRLPGSQRLDAALAARALAALDWEVVDLPGAARVSLIERFADAGVSGGAVHDALVGGTAREHGLTLVTRDRRAVRTYDALGVGCRVV